MYLQAWAGHWPAPRSWHPCSSWKLSWRICFLLTSRPGRCLFCCPAAGLLGRVLERMSWCLRWLDWVWLAGFCWRLMNLLPKVEWKCGLSRLVLVCRLCCNRRFDSFSRLLFSEILMLELAQVLGISSLGRFRELLILLKIGNDTFYQNFLFEILQSRVIVQVRLKDNLKQIILNPHLLFLKWFLIKLLDELL